MKFLLYLTIAIFRFFNRRNSLNFYVNFLIWCNFLNFGREKGGNQVPRFFSTMVLDSVRRALSEGPSPNLSKINRDDMLFIFPTTTKTRR